MSLAVPTDPGEALLDAARAALLRARKDRDAARVAACRGIITTIDDGEAVEAAQGYDYANPAPRFGATEVPRRRLEVEELRRLLRALVSELSTSAAGYRQVEQLEAAAALDAEVAVIDHLLGDVPWLGWSA